MRDEKDETILENIRKINEGVYDDVLFGEKPIDVSYPEKLRIFKLNPYLKIHEKYKTKKIVTKYRTISIDENTLKIVKTIVANSIINEKELIETFEEEFEVEELRKLVSLLLQAEAIELLGYIE